MTGDRNEVVFNSFPSLSVLKITPHPRSSVLLRVQLKKSEIPVDDGKMERFVNSAPQIFPYFTLKRKLERW